MGVSIHFPNFTLDCGYFGFKILRDRILKMVPHKKLHEIYEDTQKHLFMLDADEKKKYFDDVNKKNKRHGLSRGRRLQQVRKSVSK